MFNLGFSEMIVLAVVALIFIGPKQLPEIARVLGRLINEFKRATGDITQGIKEQENHLDQLSEEVKEATRLDPSEETKES